MLVPAWFVCTALGSNSASNNPVPSGEDIYNMMGATKLQRWQTPENRLPKEKVEAFWSESLPPHLANLEKLCSQPEGFTSTGKTIGE